MGENGVSVVVGYDNFSSGGDFESFIVRSVFFGFFGHKSDVGGVSHSGIVELSVGLTVFDDGSVDSGVTSIGDDTDNIF